jgi:voltage-gated potassium channel
VDSYYFIVTTLTTVGYGDIVGVSQSEYIFQMIIEFLGIFLISILMGTINGIVEQEPTLQDIVEERIDDLEVWLHVLDQSRNSYLP